MFLITAITCKKTTTFNNELKTQNHTGTDGYKYEMTTNNPTGLLLYILDYGLKVYLTNKTDEPKEST